MAFFAQNSSTSAKYMKNHLIYFLLYHIYAKKLLFSAQKQRRSEKNKKDRVTDAAVTLSQNQRRAF
jgi:hypothetical protein